MSLLIIIAIIFGLYSIYNIFSIKKLDTKLISAKLNTTSLEEIKNISDKIISKTKLFLIITNVIVIINWFIVAGMYILNVLFSPLSMIFCDQPGLDCRAAMSNFLTFLSLITPLLFLSQIILMATYSVLKAKAEKELDIKKIKLSLILGSISLGLSIIYWIAYEGVYILLSH